MPNSTSEIVEAIRKKAHDEGFDAVRFTRAELMPGILENLCAFLAAGHHGTMDWLARDPTRRSNPLALWPDAKSVIVLGKNYASPTDPFEALRQSETGNISVYARGKDYHDVLKPRLKKIAGFIHKEFHAEVKVFIDTAPVMEKPLAQRAGLGWQGKHTNLVSREFGSWLFIASIFTTLDLPGNDAEADHCGQCRRCLDICPTGAFNAPYQLDARRCISYLTIEHKGHIPREFRTAIGNRIYGCDDCLAVCPWNKFARISHEADFQAREELKAPKLSWLVRLDDTQFRHLFRHSPIKRIGRDRFIRNVLISIGNSGETSLATEAERLLGDSSALVRAMAVWALARLNPERANALRSEFTSCETDTYVLDEWCDAIPAVA